DVLAGTATMPLCNGAANGTITITPPSTGTAPFRYSIDDGFSRTPSNVFNNVGPGTYPIWAIDNDGCIYRGSVVVTEPTTIKVDTTITPTACPQVSTGRFTVSASGGTPPYQYAFDGNTFGSVSTFSNLDSGFFYVLLRDANGCRDSLAGTIPSLAPPVIIASNDTAICQGSTLSIRGYGPAGITYTWTNGVTNGAIFMPTATRKYYVTGTAQSGCKGTDSVTVTVNPLPVATINPAPVIICNDTSDIYLTAVTLGGTWSGTGITDPVQGIFSPSVSGPGNFNIAYNITDANGCKGNSTIRLTVTARRNATINPAGPFCTNAGVQQLSTVQSGGTWSGTAVNAAGQFDPAQATVGSNQVVYSQGGNCPASDTIYILVNSTFNAQILPGGPYCVTDAPVQLQSVTPGASWSGRGITNASIGTFDPAVAGVGTHTITHTIAGTCGTTDTEPFTVLGLDTAHILLPNDSICHDAAPMQLSATPTGGTWSGAVNSAGVFDPAGKFPGAYQVKYTHIITCAYTDSAIITIADTLKAVLPNATVPCFGNTTGSLQVTASN
ncbi:MAG: hypothetical protein V4616_08605, partial [Bacteroidota bacterium]